MSLAIRYSLNDCMAAPGERKYCLRLTFSIIGICVGVSVAIVFGINYHNLSTALWGLMSALPAAVTLVVHIGCKRRWWESNPQKLKGFMLTGCFIQLAGVCGFVAYLTLAIVLKQELKAYDDGYYLTCVWCAMTWKWGFLLFWFSRGYLRQYMNHYTEIAKHTSANPNYGS